MLFETVGYDYSRMWNDEIESLKQDGWGWANKYFEDDEEIDAYFNSDIMNEVKAGNCDNEVGVHEISRNFFLYHTHIGADQLQTIAYSITYTNTVLHLK